MSNGNVRLEVYNPTGVTGTSVVHANRLDTLEGKTICELSNAMWEHNRIFPAAREALQERFPTVKVVPYNKTIGLRRDIDNLELVSQVIKEKGCHAVITGMAA